MWGLLGAIGHLDHLSEFLDDLIDYQKVFFCLLSNFLPKCPFGSYSVAFLVSASSAISSDMFCMPVPRLVSLRSNLLCFPPFVLK